MKRFLTLFAVAGLAVPVASTAQQGGTSTKQTTVRSSGEEKTVTVSGEVLRYEPGKTIVIRHPDARVLTYTIGPSLVVPAEVQVGRRVTVFTEPSEAGSVTVTRITTVTTGDAKQTTVETSPADPPGTTRTRTSTHEVSVQDPATGSRTATTTKTTTITGDVVRIEPGRAILLRNPDRQVVTYTLAPSLTIPAEVQVGGKVTIFTEPSDSGRAVVTRVTTVTSDGGAVTREATMETPGGMQTTTTTKTSTLSGEVVLYEPGKTIVIRQPDSQVVTYALSPSLTVPAEVQVGRRVSIVTEPSASGPVLVTRVTTESLTAEGDRKITTEKTETSAAGGTKSELTTVYGTVTAYEPGKTITVVSPKRTTVTYVLDRESDLPADLAVGKTVTIRTTTAAGSPKPLVRKVTYTTRSQTSKKKSY